MRDERGLRWYAGVPIGTNPLILTDIGTILVLLWGAAMLSVTLLQLILGGSVEGSHVQGAAVFATYLILFVGGAFLVIAFVLLQNRYVVLYRFDDEKAYCESMKKGFRSMAESLHWRPFPVEPPSGPTRSTAKSVLWRDVERVYPMADMRVILLRRGRGTAMRVYCPDRAVYEKALHFIQEKVPQGR